LQPSCGTILPGGKQVVTWEYKHIVVDKHKIFALLRLLNGRRFLLSLKGETHSKLSMPILEIPRPHWEIHQPLGVFLDAIPARKFRLYNVSDEAVKAAYYINSLSDENYGVAIFRSSGNCFEIKAWCHFDLEVKFYPLMEKVYQTQLHIQVPKIENSRIVEIFGHGKAAVED